MKPTRRVQPDPVLSIYPWRESELLKRKPTTNSYETLVAIFLSMTFLAIKPIYIVPPTVTIGIVLLQEIGVEAKKTGV